jgi:hypothetical protein
MGASGASASDGVTPKHRVAVETAWRAAVNRIAATEFRDRFGRQGNSMRVERRRRRLRLAGTSPDTLERRTGWLDRQAALP